MDCIFLYSNEYYLQLQGAIKINVVNAHAMFLPQSLHDN